jgi:hypothetical protein
VLPGSKNHKKPAFSAGFVEVLGCFRMLSDDPNGGPGTNHKFPEPIDTNMVSEIEALLLPPELPLKGRARKSHSGRAASFSTNTSD